MKQIKRSYIVGAALAVAGLVGLQTAQAGIITGADTVGLSTYTTGDGLVTLNPFSGGAAGSLNVGAGYIGVSGGANNNNVGDLDGDPSTTGDREELDIVLDATVGLSQIQFQWTRADGPAADDGIVISGFLADPGAAFSGGGGLNNNEITYSAGALYMSLWNWTGESAVFDFSNLAASKGQTLTLGVNDSDQANPQAAIYSMEYAIPEPATFGLVAAMGGGLLFIRRRFRT